MRGYAATRLALIPAQRTRNPVLACFPDGTTPDRFEVGSTGWVTTRFTAADPLPRRIWEPWLEESYEMATGPRRKR